MQTTITKIVISLIALVLIAVRLKWPNTKVDTVTIGLLVVALLPWIAVLVESAELPGGWKVRFRELKNEQEKQKSDIDSLKFLVGHFVTDAELRHLNKLASNHSFPFVSGPETSFFEKELRRLRSFGLIAGHPGKGVRSLMKHGGDVKDHFYITEVGRKYLELRNEL
jgi:hypothetical protein